MIVLRHIEVCSRMERLTLQNKHGSRFHGAACYRWRKEFPGVKVDQAKRLKELELEKGTARCALDFQQAIADLARQHA